MVQFFLHKILLLAPPYRQLLKQGKKKKGDTDDCVATGCGESLGTEGATDQQPAKKSRVKKLAQQPHEQSKCILPQVSLQRRTQPWLTPRELAWPCEMSSSGLS